MQKLLIVALSVAVCLNVVLGMMLVAARKQNSQLDVRLGESLRGITNAQALAESRGRTLELLQGKVIKLTEVLTNSTAHLRAAEETIRAYESAQQARLEAEASAPLLAEIPEPRTVVERDDAGKSTKKLVFPQVVERSGKVLAREAEFGGQYGRRLVFRPESGPIAVDVATVHPAILRHLHIDAEEAIQKQARVDAGWQAQRQAAYEVFLDQQRLQQERRESEERVRIEQAKASAEIAKANAEEQAKREYIVNERIKADAAARMADAAMAGALAPVNINQNLNQTTVRRY